MIKEMRHEIVLLFRPVLLQKPLAVLGKIDGNRELVADWLRMQLQIFNYVAAGDKVRLIMVHNVYSDIRKRNGQPAPQFV